jgi:hypothetical protein
MIRKLSAEQCTQAMKDGEFDAAVRKAAARVAVVLTQSWCPQWPMMRSWLEQGALEAGAEVFFVEYDREAFFEPFMAFKEDVLGNRSVPYVRYYREGALVAQSNYLAKDGFVKNFSR